MTMVRLKKQNESIQGRRGYQRQPSRPFLRKPVPSDDDSRSPSQQSRHSTHSYSVVTNEGEANISKSENDSSASNSASSSSSALDRHLSLIDLIAIGVGGTIGSGLFVLAGLVAHEYAGPATVLSWAISGLAACLSGCCYAELAARIPLAGSTYAYSYVAMGELPAVLAAACLSLEYVASASAVARSWGDKCVVYLTEELNGGNWIPEILGTHGSFSPLAFCISAASILLLLNGVKESKLVTNIFTAMKVSLVVFMISAGFYYVRPENWKPFIPPAFGVGGVLRGATGTFFGYLGYDQVCCLAGEAQNPKRNLPIAILLTLVGVSLLYMTATLALTGMQPYSEISPVSGFPMALNSVNAKIASEITALGEIVTLPIVVLISIMAQPRLQFAMAEDGLLPPLFGEVDASGNLWKGTFISGIVMVLIATFIPFKHLNDMISCAVLSALSMTDTSLILLWHEPSDPHSTLAEKLLLAFHALALLGAISLARFLDSYLGWLVATVSIVGMVVTTFAIQKFCPRSAVFGGMRQHPHHEALRLDDGYFKTPFVPYLPCIGIFFNWYLIAQLELVGVIGLAAVFVVTIVYYFAYAAHHSVGNTVGWEAASQHDAHEEDSSPDTGTLTRSISLPQIRASSTRSAHQLT